METTLKPGNFVQLIAGGPRMTLAQMGAGEGGDQKVWCVWYHGAKKMQDAFTVSALVLAPGSPESQERQDFARRRA